MDPLVLAAIVFGILVVCSPFLSMPLNNASVALAVPPGIDPSEQAQTKIHEGMTKDEVARCWASHGPLGLTAETSGITGETASWAAFSGSISGRTAE